jgi:membrane protein implicated in regulation of membrane protease activity
MYSSNSRERSKRGKVDEILTPGAECRVKVDGVFWHALVPAGLSFSPGDYIQVVGQHGIKLLVIPLQ